MLKQQGQQHEGRIHQQRWQDEQPADEGFPADHLLRKVRRENVGAQG